MSRCYQEDGRGAQQEFAGPEDRIVGGGNGKDGANAPDELARVRGRKGRGDFVMSPTPLVLLSKNGLGWLSNGMMVREIRFQSSLKCIGTTG